MGKTSAAYAIYEKKWNVQEKIVHFTKINEPGT